MLTMFHIFNILGKKCKGHLFFDQIEVFNKFFKKYLKIFYFDTSLDVIIIRKFLIKFNIH